MMGRRANIFAALVFFSALFCSDAAGGGSTFNVLSFGAKPGMRKESTQAFIKAWKAACSSNDKATVIVPPGIYTLGETIFQGPCRSRFPVTVQVQGTLQAIPDASAYSGGWWILFSDIDGLILTGGGTIDGQGKGLWQYNDCKTNPNCTPLSTSVHMTNVSNAAVMFITLTNSMGYHMHVTNSRQVTAQSLTITAPEDSPNTDGIHISKSTTVRVTRSVIKTGGNCVSVGQGSTNVTINQIVCGPGHGISVESLGKEPNESDVRGLIVNNCTLKGTKNGIRIRTLPGSGPSMAAGILFQDIVMDSVENPIIIDQNYDTKSNKPSQVKISNVVYRNIRGTTASPIAVNLACSSKAPCENVHLQDIDLKLKGQTRPKAVCANVKAGYSGVQTPPPC